jgi:thioredoxin-dependent peroxiredoxin
MVEKGQKAPDFTLSADDGSQVKLSDLRGKKVLIYFYPKDDTPGCTTQACDLRDRMPDLKAEGAVVLGISPDSVKSHQKFKKKYGLNFPLLADEDHKVAEKYGAWGEKNNYGIKALGIIRSSFLIDEEGRIVEEWRKVKAKEHADWLMKKLRA